MNLENLLQTKKRRKKLEKFQHASSTHPKTSSSTSIIIINRSCWKWIFQNKWELTETCTTSCCETLRGWWLKWKTAKRFTFNVKRVCFKLQNGIELQSVMTSDIKALDHGNTLRLRKKYVIKLFFLLFLTANTKSHQLCLHI